jgi:hypothetical protein
MRSIIDYVIANEKAAKLIKDVRVYRRADLNTNHFLLCTKLQFPPNGRKQKL